jgi:hypothetical protein
VFLLVVSSCQLLGFYLGFQEKYGILVIVMENVRISSLENDYKISILNTTVKVK